MPAYINHDMSNDVRVDFNFLPTDREMEIINKMSRAYENPMRKLKKENKKLKKEVSHTAMFNRNQTTINKKLKEEIDDLKQYVLLFFTDGKHGSDNWGGKHREVTEEWNKLLEEEEV
jgi:regulator of replication initiation timing